MALMMTFFWSDFFDFYSNLWLSCAVVLHVAVFTIGPIQYHHCKLSLSNLLDFFLILDYSAQLFTTKILCGIMFQ